MKQIVKRLAATMLFWLLAEVGIFAVVILTAIHSGIAPSMLVSYLNPFSQYVNVGAFIIVVGASLAGLINAKLLADLWLII